MAADRFVYFDKVPSKEDVKVVLEDYLGAFMVKNEWSGGRWNVTLVGNNSWPFRRLLVMANSASAAAFEEEAKRVRWMEVYFGDDYINVMTRHGDWASGTLAAGFAKLIAQFWKGRLEAD